MVRSVIVFASSMAVGCGPTLVEPQASESSSGVATAPTGTSGSLESTASTSQGTAADTSSTGPSSTGMMGTSAGEECQDMSCEPCPAGCHMLPTCVGGEFVCGCIGCGEACDFPTLVGEVADASELPVFDCGTVMLSDDIAAWQAAHDCTLRHLSTGYRVTWQGMSIDSTVYQALVGQVGCACVHNHLDYDSWGGALVTHQFCQDVQPIVGCMVAPGEMCLECTAVADPRVVCQR